MRQHPQLGNSFGSVARMCAVSYPMSFQNENLLLPTASFDLENFKQALDLNNVPDVILVGYAQTAAVGSDLLIRSTVYTKISGRSGRLRFNRKVCLFVG